MGRKSTRNHTFEEIMDNPPDRSEISGYKTLKLIDLIGGCLHPKTEIRGGPILGSVGNWIQYMMPHPQEGRLLVSIFYCRLPLLLLDVASRIKDTLDNPRSAYLMPGHPSTEIFLNCDGIWAMDIKHIVIDGQHLSILYVIGKGWQLDPLDSRTAKVIMLLLSQHLISDYWPFVWAKYSMGRLIADMLSCGEQTISLTPNRIASMRSLALRLADTEPIIRLEEILE